MTLLHFVSEQTMQNVLPALALRPERIIQVRSGGSRYSKAADAIASALRAAGQDTEILDWKLQAEFPDLEDARQSIKYWPPLYPGAIVNITGGTKLMSAGALLGAREFPGSPILYCDSDRRRFISLGLNTPLPASMPAFDDAARMLNVRIVMAAHGKPPEQWKFETADTRLIEFGRAAFQWRISEKAAFSDSQYPDRLRKFFRGTKNRIPKATGELRSLLAADLRQAFPDPLPAPVRGFLEAAARAGVLREDPDGALRLAPPPAGRDLHAHVERMANILDGSWLELAVLDFIESSTTLSDPHWSVQPVSSAKAPDADSFGETDIVCIRRPAGVLQVISCKTGITKPLEHIESLRERTSHLGGRFARATLAVLDASESQARNLRRWGRLLDVEILIGPDIVRLAD